MPDVTQDRNYPIVKEIVDGYGDALLPGAVEFIAESMRAPNVSLLSRERAAELVAQRLNLPHIRERVANPEFSPPPLPDGGMPSPLRVAISRHAATLKPESIDRLTAEWGPDLNRLDEVKMAREVARRVHDRKAWDHHKESPPLPEGEQRKIALIMEQFPQVKDPADIARRFANEPDHVTLGRVARDLSNPIRAAQIADGEGIAPTDPRLNRLPNPAEARSVTTIKSPRF